MGFERFLSTGTNRFNLNTFTHIDWNALQYFAHIQSIRLTFLVLVLALLVSSVFIFSNSHLSVCYLLFFIFWFLYEFLCLFSVRCISHPIQRNRMIFFFFDCVPFRTISLLGKMNGICALLLAIAANATTTTFIATRCWCICVDAGKLLRLGVIHGEDHITNEEKQHGKPTKIIVAW